MTSNELRREFRDFFVARGHKLMPSSPLLDVSDPSVLLTTAGMQQFKPYFAGKRNAKRELGTDKVVTIQKCFRTSDINEVGDKDHLTFLEMLGNFAFQNAYWKKEAIGLAVDFLTKILKVKKTDFQITVFKGDKEVSFDKESYQVWLNLGFSKEQISRRGREDNFWGPTGDEGPCGPTTEIYLSGSEIWNIVFNEYFQDKKGNLVPLAQKGIDTGMGLERLAMVIQNKKNVFGTDLFSPLRKTLRNFKYQLTKNNLKEERVILDHLRGSVFLISEGLLPSNVKEGYILRRVLRRAIRSALKLSLDKSWMQELAKSIIGAYSDFYPELKKEQKNILSVLEKERDNFEKVLSKGVRELEKMLVKVKAGAKNFPPEFAFSLYESYGFPPELTEELLRERGYKFDWDGFHRAQKKHQRLSRHTFEKKVGGLRSNPSYYEVKLHTATHLLHQALRDVLGKEVKQMGSDINEKRLRFDFSFNRALTDEELAEVTKIINQKIAQDLKVDREETTYEKAIKKGALGFFKERYPKHVSVYTIHPQGDKKNFYSAEICRGPHVTHTSELKKFIILKQEAVGAGVRRIKARVEK